MERFSQFCQELENTLQPVRKSKALTKYLIEVPDKDKLWAIGLLTNHRPRRIVTLKTLSKWASESANIPTWLLEESYRHVGDLSETVSLIVKNQTIGDNIGLADMILQLKGLQSAEESEKKEFVLEIWNTHDFYARFIFNKLLTGGFRTVVSQKIILDALAEVTGKETGTLAHRISEKWDPTATTFNELVLSENKLDDQSKPYPLFEPKNLEGNPKDLGSLHNWIVLKNLNGVHVQLISRGNQIFLWDRAEELITGRFPEFKSLSSILPNGLVLEGELLIWKKNGLGNFLELEKRVKRTKPSKKIITELPAILVAHDLLENGGIDLRGESTEKRRELLENLFLQFGTGSEQLLLSEKVIQPGWTELKDKWSHSRQKGIEGFILKQIKAPYPIKGNNEYWLNWKAPPFIIHAVLLYAQSGSGRRAGEYTEFTLAAWHGESLVPFVKVSSNLDELESLEISQWIRDHTVERFGPVRSVAPHLVFKIEFEGIAPSIRHKSGIILRFPKILNWSKEKLANETATLASIKMLL